MDFLVDLPIDWNCTTVLTMVEHFSMMYIIVPLSSITAEHMAQAFFQHVVTHHGLPHHIISDRNTRFSNKFWRALIKEMKTELHLSTTLHPQSDSLVEVSNRILEQLPTIAPL